MLNKLTFSGTRELWKAVKKVLYLPICVTMTFYPTQIKLMITLLQYALLTLMIEMRLRNIVQHLKLIDVRPHVNDNEVEILLRTVKRTAAGCDNLQCSFELSSVVTHIFNLSFTLGQLPTTQGNGYVL